MSIVQTVNVCFIVITTISKWYNLQCFSESVLLWCNLMKYVRTKQPLTRVIRWLDAYLDFIYWACVFECVFVFSFLLDTFFYCYVSNTDMGLRLNFVMDRARVCVWVWKQEQERESNKEKKGVNLEAIACIIVFSHMETEHANWATNKNIQAHTWYVFRCDNELASSYKIRKVSCYIVSNAHWTCCILKN